MIDLDAIQAEQKEWAAKNFPDTVGIEVILGIIEEVGELVSSAIVAGHPDGAMNRAIRLADFVGSIAHHTLKCRQGIRGDEEYHDRQVVELSNQIETFVCRRNFAPSSGLHERVTHFLNDDEARDAVGDIMIFILDLCNRQGWSLQDILASTWEEVKQREWAEPQIVDMLEAARA